MNRCVVTHTVYKFLDSSRYQHCIMVCFTEVFAVKLERLLEIVCSITYCIFVR